MSLVVGVVSSSKNMGFEETNEGSGKVVKSEINVKTGEKVEDEGRGETGELQIGGGNNKHVFETGEEEEEEEEDGVEGKIELGPLRSLKEQFEKDKDDESLRRWKEQLLGSVDINSVGEILDPEVKILSLAIVSPGRPDIVLPIPVEGKTKGSWFTLKEGSRYNIKFTFQVSNNIVSGLRYTNTVWKTSIKVDTTREMIGTFSPQQESYTHEMPEETTPSGIFARGTYSARTKFVDDDNKCYLKLNYTFDIKRDWQ